MSAPTADAPATLVTLLPLHLRLLATATDPAVDPAVRADAAAQLADHLAAAVAR